MSITVEEMLKRGCLFMVTRDQNLYVAIKPVVEMLGLNWAAQLAMFRRDPLFAEALTPLAIPDESGKGTEVLGLTMPYLAGWTMRLNPNDYEGKLRDDVIAMQRECYRTLGICLELVACDKFVAVEKIDANH